MRYVGQARCKIRKPRVVTNCMREFLTSRRRSESCYAPPGEVICIICVCVCESEKSLSLLGVRGKEDEYNNYMLRIEVVVYGSS